MPAEMDQIMEIVKEKDIAVIEDASHAHGAEYKGKKVGSIGDIGVFSFQGTKLMPAGEGGIFLTNNEEYFEKALALGHYERVKTPFVSPASPYLKYATTTSMGMKFRMSPLHAAIGLAYLETLDEDNKSRNAYCEKFRAVIRTLPGFDAFETPKHIKRVFYEHHIQYDETERKISNKQMAETLQAEGVSLSAQRYRLIHQQPYFQEKGYPKDLLPITDRSVGMQFRVPNFSVKSDELLNQYINAFEKVSRLLK
jgi:dTDP-4-amino-4,6-dideoxygalactose transaminase